MFKKVAEQFNIKNSLKMSPNVASPFDVQKNSSQKNLLKQLSEHALNLYQKKMDIKKFTKLVLSNPEDKSHEELIKDNNLDEYDLLFDLSNNDEFLKDLDL